MSGGGEILGRPVFSSLQEIDRPVDIVDVFRRSEDCESIAHDAVAIGAKVLWLQEDVVNAAAEQIAKDVGLLNQAACLNARVVYVMAAESASRNAQMAVMMAILAQPITVLMGFAFMKMHLRAPNARTDYVTEMGYVLKTNKEN